ncbi:MAG TPA: tudor domain-containing protein [Sandaracinaceae bacterium LLY-WYZ-13_1]|nr:tudor domain-containing protein [Sandaracinaceae bacterium LLY-WYZ-13_1]
MRGLIFTLPLLAAGCVGSSGPELPPNVGASHESPTGGGGESSAGPREPARPAEPMTVGTPVWASFRDTGFYFQGVVVERRDDGQHRVVYADGGSEWVSARSLRPDALGADARVHVRSRYDGDFSEGQVGRRLGQALYVRLANGDEGWTALPHVRFAAGDPDTPSLGDAPPASPPPDAGSTAVGSTVLVNYQHQGLRFAGVVTAVREDGRKHVVYLDGETEWVDPVLVAPDDLDEGDVVHIRRRWDPPEWVRGHVRRRLGHAFQVELDDGGMAWTSLFRLRAPEDDDAPTEPGEPDGEDHAEAPGARDAG